MKARLALLAVLTVSTGCAKKGGGSGSSGGGDSGAGTIAVGGGGSVTTASTGTSSSTVTASTSTNVAVAGTVEISTSLADAAALDTLIAMPLDGNDPDPSKSDWVTTQIAGDGTFSLTLPRADASASATVTSEGGRKWMLIAYASHPELSGLPQRTAQAESMVFVEMSDGTNDLLALPVSDAKSATLNLGTITPDAATGDAKASLTLDASVFTTSLAQLVEAAGPQHVLKDLRNFWMNSSPNGEYIGAAQDFTWYGSPAPANNQFGSPTDVKYGGYGIDVTDFPPPGATPTISFSSLCNVTTPNLVLTPPAAIGVVDRYGNSIGTVTQFGDGGTSDGAAGGICTAANNTVSGMVAYSSGGLVGFNWSAGGGWGGAVPAGLWPLTYNGTTIANFDLASGKPLDADGNAFVYIPVLNATVNASDDITALSIKLMRYDRTTSAYVEVSDLTTFNQLVQPVGLQATFYNFASSPATSEGASSPKTLAQSGDVYTWSTFTNHWLFPKGGGQQNSDGALVANLIIVYYELFGATYNFVYYVN